MSYSNARCASQSEAIPTLEGNQGDGNLRQGLVAGPV